MKEDPIDKYILNMAAIYIGVFLILIWCNVTPITTFQKYIDSWIGAFLIVMVIIQFIIIFAKLLIDEQHKKIRKLEAEKIAFNKEFEAEQIKLHEEIEILCSNNVTRLSDYREKWDRRCDRH